jgi:hypothetical protein
MSGPLDDAYQSVREFLHGRDQSDEARESLRSLLWLCAEGLERFGLSGREVRDLGDDLTGAETSEALHAMIGGGS